MIIAGIDPGAQSTIAVLFEDNTVEFCEDTCVQVKRSKSVKREPEAHLIANFLRGWDPDLVIIEQVNIRPGEGVASGGSFMRARGICEGVVAGLGRTFHLVPPVVWTRDMKLKKGDDAGRARALELMPSLAASLTRKKDHNRADAVLLALWGRQFLVPKHPLFS